MTTIYLHGGPGFRDYLEDSFRDFHRDDALFYTQKRPIAAVDEAIEELADKVAGLDPIVLVGHSWGGILALAYLEKYGPRGLSGLVLMSTPISFHVTAHFQKECESRGLVAPQPTEIFLAAAERAQPAPVSFLKDLMEDLEPRSLQAIWDSFFVRFDFHALLRALPVPGLIIYGSEDLRVPAWSQGRYLNLNSRFQEIKVDGAGHFPFLLPAHREQTGMTIQNFVRTL